MLWPSMIVSIQLQASRTSSSSCSTRSFIDAHQILLNNLTEALFLNRRLSDQIDLPTEQRFEITGEPEVATHVVHSLPPVEQHQKIEIARLGMEITARRR